MGRERERERDGDGEAGAGVNGAGIGVNANAGEEPIESWKRAAEVTSQLKARIEMMKVCLLAF